MSNMFFQLLAWDLTTSEIFLGFNVLSVICSSCYDQSNFHGVHIFTDIQEMQISGNMYNTNISQYVLM